MIIAFNIATVLLVLLIGYWWANQGVFSAMIHLLCVIVAGALAFALWEPVALGLFMRGSKFDPYAWGVSLLLIFMLALFVLRLATNKLVPANLDVPRWANLAFGLPLGLAAGVLTVGILVLGAGFVQSQRSLVGYTGYARNNAGTIVSGEQPWVPFHKITADFYGMLSVGAFKSPSPMRRFQPRLDRQAFALVRDTFKNGRGQISMRPGAASVTGTYLAPDRCLVKVRFGRAARDFGEQLTLSASQVRLVSRAAGFDEPYVAHPARWSQEIKDEGTGVFEFNDISNYLTMIPARESADVVLEFPWSTQSAPAFIQIKGTRFDMGRVESATDQQCDEILRGGQPGRQRVPDLAGLPSVPTGDLRATAEIRPVTTSTNLLPGGMKQIDRYLDSGSGQFEKSRIMPARNLAIQGIYAPKGVQVVQLDTNRNSTANLYGDASVKAGQNAFPMLVDSNGNTYSAIGYVHVMREATEINLDPTNGMRLKDLPHLPTSGSETMRLVFRVTEGAQIVAFQLGDVPVARCSLSVPVPR